MKLLILVTQLERAGAQRVALDLAADRVRRGDDVTLAYFYDKLDGTAGLLDGAPFRCLDLQARSPGRAGPVDLLRALRGCARLFLELRQGDHDAVVTFTRWSNLLGSPLARLAGVPLRLASQQVVLEDAPGWMRALDGWLVNRGVTSRMIACSESVRDFCVEREGMDPARVEVIANGVTPLPRGDPERARAELEDELGLPPAGPLLLSLGRLAPQKGYETLVDAAPAILARHPGAAFLVAGEGPERSRLAARAGCRGVADSIRWLGSRSDVPRLLDAATLLLHPTRREGLPLALLEAALHEVPIVTTRSPGTREVVTDGLTGRAVAVDDPGGLAAATLELLEDPSLAAALARRAREEVEVRYALSGLHARWDAALRAGGTRPAAYPGGSGNER